MIPAQWLEPQVLGRVAVGGCSLQVAVTCKKLKRHAMHEFSFIHKVEAYGDDEVCSLNSSIQPSDNYTITMRL